MSPNIIGNLGLAAAHAKIPGQELHKRGCNLAAGDLYVAPTAGAVIDPTQPLIVKWATDCSLSSQVNVMLYNPGEAGLVARQTADYSTGQLQVNFGRSLCNSTDPLTMHFVIGSTTDPIWDPSSPPGPSFEVLCNTTTPYSSAGQTASAKGPTVTSGGDAIMQTVASTKGNGGISKGAIAAAVIVPIIFVAALVGVAVRFWRVREAEKRKRWSAAVSTHSGLEWEKGARPGEQPPSVLGRPSTHYSFRPGSLATSSVYAVENNMAGTGAGQNFPRPSFQLRSQSVENVNSPSVRQSRISFAETTRPDRSSRFSLGDNLRPTIGKLPGGSKSASDLVTPSKRPIYAHGSALADDDDVNVSPSQLQSPRTFTEASIARAGEGQRTGRRSFMSLGGGDKRRMSAVSNVSADDFKSAASARGSVDELRDMEATVLARRSMISQMGSPAVGAQEEVEALEAVTPLPSAPSAGTVAYGPDQMLAVYAARGKVSNSSNTPSGMRSFTHLNTGTVSSAAVDALPAPGPNSLAVPSNQASRLSGTSEISAYSNDDQEVGEAK